MMQVGQAGDGILVGELVDLARALARAGSRAGAAATWRAIAKPNSPTAISAPNGSSRNIIAVAGRSDSQLNQPTMRPLASISDCTSRSAAGASSSNRSPLRPEARSSRRISFGSTCARSGETACSASMAPRSAWRCSAFRDSRRPAAPARSRARSRRRSRPRPAWRAARSSAGSPARRRPPKAGAAVRRQPNRRSSATAACVSRRRGLLTEIHRVLRLTPDATTTFRPQD